MKTNNSLDKIMKAPCDRCGKTRWCYIETVPLQVLRDLPVSLKEKVFTKEQLSLLDDENSELTKAFNNSRVSCAECLKHVRDAVVYISTGNLEIAQVKATDKHIKELIATLEAKDILAKALE
jgi:methyl-accepting chemotaxis protein